jgi:hypothetical protein
MRFRLLAVVALTLFAAGCGTSTGTATGAPSSAAATSAAGSTPPDITASPPVPGASPRAAGGWCAAGDLSVAAVQGNGAMGHIGYPIVVTNTTGSACTLSGATPVVLYRTAGGATATLPTKAAEPAAADYTLAPGARARTLIYIVNGYGGFDPSAPECAHPATYHNLSVQLKNGDAVAVAGFTLDVKCGDILVYNWAAVA